MRKFVTFLLCLSFLLTACAAMTPVFALSADVSDSTWSDVDLKALVYQEDMSLYSDLNEDYEYYDWCWKEIPELEDDELQLAQVNMRGFAITPDRKYALMGHLNGGGFHGCALFDFETGTITDVFYRYDEEMPDFVCPFSYPKGIAADDRGNVYVGFSFCQNFNVVNLGIAHINDETKTFEELYMGAICEFGEPGVSAGGTQVATNGVEVVKLGERYYCYVMTNYKYDALYCYDVTDPSNPALVENFGDNGKIVFSDDDCAVKGKNFTLDDGDYFAVDEEGVIWLAAKSKEGKRGVMKIAPDGSACIDVVNATNPYSVCRAGKYLIIGDRDGKLLHVYDASDTDQEIASIAPNEYAPEGSRFSRVQVIDDILFVVSNQENDASQANAILAAALTADAQVKLNKMAAQLTEEEETEPGDRPWDEPATEPGTEDWSRYDPSWDEPATEPGTDPVTDPETEPATEPENEGRVECIGSANDITFSGWASLGQKRIAAYGYAFNGDWSNAVWSEDFVKEADSAVIEAAGSRYATRYEITVDASRIPATGLRMLNLLVRATDGSVYELASWDTIALKPSSGVGGEIDRTDATNRSDSDSMTADPAETDEDKFDRNDKNKRNNDDDDEYDEDIFQFDFEGCSSTIGAGAAALVLPAMAAAVALKKKH